jgi:hypothetical protein
VDVVDDRAAQRLSGIQVILAHCIDAEQGTELSAIVLDDQIKASIPAELRDTGAMATALGTRALLETVAGAAVELVDAIRELSTSNDPMRRPTSIEDVVATVWQPAAPTGRRGSRLSAAS